MKLRDRIAGVQAEIDQIVSLQSSLEFELESSRGEVMHGQTDRELRDDRVRVMTGEKEWLEAKLSTLSSEVTALKVKTASVTERGEAARLRVDLLSVQLEELSERSERPFRRTRVASLPSC